MEGTLDGEDWLIKEIEQTFCFGQWPNYMDKYVRTGTSAL